MKAAHSFRWFYVAGLLLATACSAEPGENQAETAKEAITAAPKSIEGWSGLKFGMSLDEAVGQVSGVKWNPVSMEECMTEMAVSGCNLFPDRENSYLPLIEGALFLPSLSFNQKGQLTDIDLSYRYEGTVQPTECEAIHARTGDRLLKEFSQDPPKRIHDKPAGQGWRRDAIVTDAGYRYTAGRKLSDGSFVTTPNTFGTAPDGSHVGFFSSLVAMDDKNLCHVNVFYEGPTSLQRKKD